jgi:hypothetical protein
LDRSDGIAALFRDVEGYSANTQLEELDNKMKRGKMIGSRRWRVEVREKRGLNKEW